MKKRLDYFLKRALGIEVLPWQMKIMEDEMKIKTKEQYAKRFKKRGKGKVRSLKRRVK